ncbi:DUF2388 domain-containing protein [Pseudomonas oryzae]|uniref:DUF2388 domain-containing protein n=1 Tax=Pseudomonas oryzae TaxID=1392877 RepID=A0A1H1PKH5_9PSED|nr:DUF2388 domain-containing protein [Pseudomonas oryzae]SDS11587.1 conserverd hypothetical protein [Pseudomonas oryzae]
MRYTLLFASLALSLATASAVAGGIGVKDAATSAGISASLYSTFKDDKIVVAAKDDASSFIASGGTIRGAYLEAALEQIRREHPGLQATDQELAAAILAQPGDAAAR